MKMQKIQFRIGELAKQLNVEKFVIRFWEKEFSVETNRSHGGQRFYTQEDLDHFKAIKSLLYDKGFTIAGAKKLLINPENDTMMGSYKTNMASNDKETTDNNHHKLIQKALSLRKKLVALKEIL